MLDGLESGNIHAYVDLSDYTEGTHKVDVKVEGTDTKVQYTSKVKQIEIKISKK